MATTHTPTNTGSATTSHIESGEFPFPLTVGAEESPYLSWLRNHSNYMAARGLFDYLRAGGVLGRGIIVNFLTFLPYLLIVAIGLAYAHHWMLAHPFRLTLGVFVLAITWILIFPVTMPLFKIVTHNRSVETGRESSVNQRDRYERSFGALLLAILTATALESLPWMLEYLHDLIWQGKIGWQTVAAGLALLSGSNKLLSVLSGIKKKVAMVLIGILGLLIPLLVILFTMDFLLYGLPPSALWVFSPLIVPVVGVIGVIIAIPLGLWQRAFTRKEFFGVVGLLIVSAVLVVTVIYLSFEARKNTSKSLEKLDRTLTPITEIASPFENIANKQEMTADVAKLVDGFVNANREYKTELNELKPLETQFTKLRENIMEHRKDNRPPCDHFPQSLLGNDEKLPRQFSDCLKFDELKAEWDRRYFSHQLQFVLWGNKLSRQSNESLAPLRRELARLAHGKLLELIKETSDADQLAELLRRTLVAQYLSPKNDPGLEDNPVSERFHSFINDDNPSRDAINHARDDLQKSAIANIVTFISEKQLAKKVGTKFKEVPGKAETAELAGKEELTKLLTKEELLDLVFPVEVSTSKEFVTRDHRKGFLEDAVSLAPQNAPGDDEYKKEMLDHLATLAEPIPRTEQSGAALTFGHSLAFFYATRADLARPNQDEAVGGEYPTVAEIATAAGTRLAKLALNDFDIDHLMVLAIDLDSPVTKDTDKLETFLQERDKTLENLYEETVKDKDKNEQLQAFLKLEKLPSKDLITYAFPLSQGEEIAASAEPVGSSKPYQWSNEYRAKVILAGKALGNDTDELARLAREELIEMALDPATQADERNKILEIFGDFPPTALGNDELARIAIAKVSSNDSALADNLITAVMFGAYGRLEQSKLARVKGQVTNAVMLPKLIFVTLLMVVIWLGCWLTVDVNLTSVHGLYRDRLASAFLIGRDTKGDIGIEEDIDLDDICRYEARSSAPYHIVNVALNLQGSKDIGIRDRKSDFFIFSKRFIGGRRTGYCRSETMEQVFPQMDLATAMAISAAAASPNMGRGTSPLLVAFMTLLNIRLGSWVPNPGILEESRNQPFWKRRRKDQLRATQPMGFSFNEVFAEELQEIEKRWGQAYPDGSRHRDKKRDEHSAPTVARGLVGIGFSGGGIRSASFNLGITQTLYQYGVFDHLDYMSTVSGGGYLGSSISTLMRSREKLFSEIAGTVKIEAQEEKIVIVKPSEAGETQRTYRFANYAILNVRDGEVIRAGHPLLQHRSARGKSEIAGTVTVENLGSGECIVKVQGKQSNERQEYRVSKLESVLVKTGDTVKVGDKLIQRYDTLGGRFRWRIRPTAFLREMLSKLNETHRWVNLSDGGHIENLATIELLRRRCKYIIIGDGEADPNLHFSGLATLMRCAYIDLGIRININLDELRLRKSKEEQDVSTVSGAHWAVGTITYPGNGGNDEPEIGYLLYLKSSFNGDEGEEIREYRHRNPTFPHQTTADQFFDEDQFEAYRALGQHIADGALQTLTAANPAIPVHKMSFNEFEAMFSDLKEEKQKQSETSTAIAGA